MQRGDQGSHTQLITLPKIINKQHHHKGQHRDQGQYGLACFSLPRRDGTVGNVQEGDQGGHGQSTTHQEDDEWLKSSRREERKSSNRG